MNLLKEYIRLEVKKAIKEALKQDQIQQGVDQYMQRTSQEKEHLEKSIDKSLFTLEQVISNLKDKTIIFLDTETTGVDPKREFTMITQIAAVAYDTNTGKKLGEINVKAHLTDAVKARMAEEAERIAAGTWPAEKPTVEKLLDMTSYFSETAPFKEENEMMEDFLVFVENYIDRSPLLVAHNARFDMQQINAALQRHELPKLPKFPVIDTMVLNKNYLFPLFTVLEKEGEPAVQPLLKVLRPNKSFLNRLGNLGDAWNISTEHWHDALADVQQLAGILSATIKFFEKYKR